MVSDDRAVRAVTFLRREAGGVTTLCVAGELDISTLDALSHALDGAVQESVTNTIRHAGARELWIEVSADGSGMVLNAVDDGRGAVEPVLGNGLRGLRERFEVLGGAVTFDGSAGFRVSARVPAP